MWRSGDKPDDGRGCDPVENAGEIYIYLYGDGEKVLIGTSSISELVLDFIDSVRTKDGICGEDAKNAKELLEELLSSANILRKSIFE